ncbi:MAG: response regulator [Thermodesulfobacteriota bacterium]
MPADTAMKILVVDDFATMRRILRNNLQAMGFTNVHEANDGFTALERLRQEPFDLVLSDWNMPTMTGLELLKKVRADPSLRRLPFIMITAEGQEHNIISAIQEKVSQYVVKPFTPEILADKIRSVFP